MKLAEKLLLLIESTIEIGDRVSIDYKKLKSGIAKNKNGKKYYLDKIKGLLKDAIVVGIKGKSICLGQNGKRKYWTDAIMVPIDVVNKK